MKETDESIRITPWLSVRESLRALDFYCKAFGATISYRLDMPDSVIARLSIRGAEFWIGDESPEHGNFSPRTLKGSTTRMILTVQHPEEVVAQAVSAGATVIFPVSEEHGWRLGRVEDPFGHHWEIGHEV